MPPAVVNDPILKRFRAALDELYGGRIERVVLMDSRARGDACVSADAKMNSALTACEDSDYDVAVFLRDMPDRFAEKNRLADLSTDILDETGEFIHAMLYRAGSYNERTLAQLSKSLLSFRP